MSNALIEITKRNIASFKQTIADFPTRSNEARAELDNATRALAHLTRQQPPRPPAAPVPEYMKQPVDALDVLPMTEQPAYVEAYGLLHRFMTELASVTQRLQDLRGAEFGGELVDDHMALLDGGLPPMAAHVETSALVVKQAALHKAVRLHEIALVAVEARLGAEAGSKVRKEHHKRVASIKASLLALHEANRMEAALRLGLEQRGYDRHGLVAASFLPYEVNPHDSNGTSAFYWAQEHRGITD